MICSAKLVLDSLVKITLSKVGAAEETVSNTDGAGEGVRSKPDAVASAAEMVIMLAVVPDCNSAWLLPRAKTASVEFAGIVNWTVFPPVPNCTVGSGLNWEEIEIVKVPLTANGYGDASDSPMAG